MRPVQFQVNGANVPNQSTLDLVAGANVTLSVSGAHVTIASSGGGGSPPSGAENLVYATPNGSSGAASLRKLVVADLPNPIDVGVF